MPSQKRLLELFTYDPLTGFLYWKQPKKFSRKRPGDRAGYDQTEPHRSYNLVEIENRTCKAHRIIWTMCNGPIPDGLEIDHIDHDGLNNRLENLRLVTHRENSHNKSLSKFNKSGYPGVHFHKRQRKWIAAIQARDSREWLGTFPDKASAIQAMEAAFEKRGYHPNHGKNERPRLTA